MTIENLNKTNVIIRSFPVFCPFGQIFPPKFASRQGLAIITTFLIHAVCEKKLISRV